MLHTCSTHMYVICLIIRLLFDRHMLFICITIVMSFHVICNQYEFNIGIGLTAECIVPDEFVYTTVSTELESEQADFAVSCQGCSGLCESLLLVDESRREQSKGWCVHTMSVPDVVSVLTLDSAADLRGSAFQQFVKRECSSKQPCECILLCKHMPRSRFLVITTTEDARSENVPRHSVCTLTQAANSWSVHCNSVLCKRGKNKLIKNIKSVNDVCCHIRKVVSRSADAASTAEISMDDQQEENQGKLSLALLL